VSIPATLRSRMQDYVVAENLSAVSAPPRA